MIGHRPADDAAAEGIDDDRQIDELLLQADVGDVGHPQLIGPVSLSPRARFGTISQSCRESVVCGTKAL